MANTAAVCNSFKSELMLGDHAFATTDAAGRTSTKDDFKAALYYSTATITKSTTAYTTTGEVTGSGYTAEGIAVPNTNAPANASDVTYWTPSGSLVYTTITTTSATDAVLIFNDTQANRAVAVYTFAAQTITAGTLTLTMPTNDQTTGLLRIA